MLYKDKVVVEYLKYGWPLNFTSDQLPVSDQRNHKGARDYRGIIDLYLSAESKLNRICGPFQSPPFEPFFTSPLNTVPKSDSQDRRVIVDLSWPLGKGVNSGIDVDLYLGAPSDLHFPTIDDVIRLVNLAGTGCLIYKRDLKAAYRQFPVDPSDYRFLGYYWNGLYYFDTRLCMGQRSAALACQRSTRAVVFIMLAKSHTVTVYLDDFIGVERVDNAWRAYYALEDLLQELGLQESASKALPPSSHQVVLGVLFDTINMSISIPKSRVDDTRVMVDSWLSKSKASKRELQSLLGKLMFISKCVRQSRIFLNRIIAAIRALKHSFYKQKLNKEFRKDLLWWKEFLVIFNGVSIIPNHNWSDPDAVFATDACLSGCGGVSGSSFFRSEFPVSIQNRKLPIHDLELLAVLVGFRVWKTELTGRRVLVYCDNMASVYALNSGKSSGEFSARCLRELWFLCCTVQAELRAIHLPGVDNRLPDYLSRSHIDIEYFNKFLVETNNLYNENFIDSSYFHMSDSF